ncbi:MAG: PEP-utilizing enzyme [Acidimicrobiia bacterium]
MAPGTDPSWIPLLQQAGALVIERGGPLSHAAILARELGIPAVVNAVGATTLLSPGVEIEVDGTRGEVWVGDWPERASQSQAGGPAGESV